MLWAVIIVLWGACLAIFLALARGAPLMEETEYGLVYVGRSPSPAATEHEPNGYNAEQGFWWRFAATVTLSELTAEKRPAERAGSRAGARSARSRGVIAETCARPALHGRARPRHLEPRQRAG